MKILQVFDFISLEAGGGTVNIINHLSRALAERGHEVEIFAGDIGLDSHDSMSIPGVQTQIFHTRCNLFGFQLMPGIIRESRKRLQDFDIIHLHSFRSFQNIIINHYASKYRIPFVLDAHGSLPRTARRNERMLKLLKWKFDILFGYGILNNAVAVIAETEAGTVEYKKFGVKEEKITLITPPFMIEEYAELPPPGSFRKEYGITDKKVILFLGRIHWIKGLDFLVESISRLTDSREDVILVIAGQDDGFKSSLENQIRQLALADKVLFTGFIVGKEKLSALADADIVVQPSVYEQGTGVPFEAILCNTPIIVSKNTIASENVSNINAGYLVEYGDVEQMCSTINRILDNPEEAAEKVRRGKKYIEANLSLEKEVIKYEQLYADCVDLYQTGKT